jgi:protoporphyrinogen/coproporphyrinogen III oxidase
MVVNLYYNNPSIVPVHGFGYLIPRSIPWNQNPERALGVIFDSDASIGQDTAPGTKITVMLGGHWWDDFDSYPDEAEGAEMAKAILKRHLNIEEEPSIVNVSLQKDCIPQYTVGHDARMKSAHGELLRAFNGKLIVAGNSYTGVGLNDCVRAARDVVMGIKDGTEDFTGLDHFLSEKWLVKPVEKLLVKMPSTK